MIFNDIRNKLMEKIPELKDRFDVIGELQLVNGFINPELMQDTISTMSLLPITIPLIAFVEVGTGKVHFITMRSLEI